MTRLHPVSQLPGATLSKRIPPPGKLIDVGILMRSRRPESKIRSDIRALAAIKPGDRRRLSWAEFARIYSVTPADLRAVRGFERSFRMRVTEEDPVLGYHRVQARIRDFERAFGVKIVYFEQAGEGMYRSYLGAIRPPAPVARILEAVVGLDDRSATVPHVHHGHRVTGKEVEPDHVARRYKYPKSHVGDGQAVAIIELGGGFYPADIRRQFKQHYKLAPPKITTISIHHHRNLPAKRADVRKYLDAFAALAKKGAPPLKPVVDADLEDQIRWTIETSLDVQLAGALAPGAELKVYFAPNKGHGKFHALAEALRDPDVSVVSCSWGTREDSVSEDFVRAFEILLTKAALLGVTVCCSSGDDYLRHGDLHVFYPASSTLVLSCGGTRLRGGSAERAWNELIAGSARAASTGGTSRIFRTPSWQGSRPQRATGAKGRGVPDVAAKADIQGGYSITVAGREIPMGGTSAAAPAWAALVARLNQKTGARMGYFTQSLYTRACAAALTDITRGTNGVFKARPGWDACTGLGSPVGEVLLQRLSK